MPSPAMRLLDEACDAAASDRPGTELTQTARLEVTGAGGHLPSRFPVADTAVACVGAALLAAVALHRQRGGAPSDVVKLDRGHVAAAVRSEAFFRRGGESAGAGFARLSRFWRTADGWVRTHANYPWHQAALLRALGTSDDAGAVAGAMAEMPAAEVEERVFAAGGIAGAVRSLDAWRAHPQGRAVAEEPLIGHQIMGDASPRRRNQADLPAEGVRVLDLTRVIAGPVCTRFMAALGADVLRVDPPRHPDIRFGAVADTLLGKRSSLVDFAAPDGLATLHRLLDQADVVVHGYRPGALDLFGLGAESLAERHPGLVVVYLDAWGYSGPWAGRRGFDSIVQAPSGIAMGESGDGGEPGALPCQLLDHGTGYLAAAAVSDGLRRQAEQGGTQVRTLSLGRTAAWLTSKPSQTVPASGVPDGGLDPEPWLVELDSAGGPVSAVAPPGRLGARPLLWRSPLTGYGTDPAAWS